MSLTTTGMTTHTSTTTRDCHGFTNLCGSWVWVGKGAGTGWPFTPPEKPVPVAWVSQGFTGSQSAQKKFFFWAFTL